MKYKLMQGRPETNDGRLDKEIACYDLLDSLEVLYERIDHEEANTMEACKEIDEVLGATICKNLFLTNRQHTSYYLLLMPDDKVFKTKEITKQIGSARLSFASGEEMEQLINCTPGSSSILGLMFDKDNTVQLVVDQDVLKGEYFGCHPCINTSSLRLRTEDVFGKILDALHHTMMVVELHGE